MFVVIWKGASFIVHYQRAINPTECKTRWSWGPLDGSFLVPITEAHALAMITSTKQSFIVEVNSGD